MELDAALERALDGEAILFAGAGCSAGAVSIAGKPLWLANEFADHLSVETHLPDKTPLEDCAEAYVEEFGEDALIRLVKQQFTVKEIGIHHRDIGSIPWKRLYTTNYDDVLEEAYRENSRQLVPVTTIDSPYNISKPDTICVHLNG